MIDFEPIDFGDIDGWENDDSQAVLACFKMSSRRMIERPYSTKQFEIDGERLASIARQLADQEHEINGTRTARRFFEDNFVPCRIRRKNSGKEIGGFVTGYYEPEIRASPVQTSEFRFPIFKRPPDLVSVDDLTRPSSLPPSFMFARKLPDGELVEYHDRKAIENGALDGLGLELFWFESLTDVFFIHVQGSARLNLPDGSVRRIGYAGKTGHPFTAIGKLLLERGKIDREDVSMQAIRAWLASNASEAKELMWENRSFIFFAEFEHTNPDLGPIGAAGIPLTPGRSLAIDHMLYTFGTPIWVATRRPLSHESKPYRRLMVAQDTGSAIVGPARGDLFIGSGDEAGEIAGRIKHEADFVVMLPAK